MSFIQKDLEFIQLREQELKTQIETLKSEYTQIEEEKQQAIENSNELEVKIKLQLEEAQI